MKNIILNIVASVVVALGFVACDKTIESLNMQPPFEYTEKYFENLRAYKQADHSICFVWFADYQSNTSPAYRFAGIPDSVDVVSLWGGIPVNDESQVRAKTPTRFYNPLAHKEMLEMMAMKATKVVVPTIIRIRDFYDILDVKDNDDFRARQEEILRKFADYLLQDVFDLNLDGLDLDFEPEGDPLDGDVMTMFVKILGEHIGPMSPNPHKLLIVDGQMPATETEPYINLHVAQAYGQIISDYNFGGAFPNRKRVFAETLEADWTTGGNMKQQAAFQPSKGGRKGGFGAYHCQRDYNTNESGGDKSMPYGHLRRAIQLQNPAIAK